MRPIDADALIAEIRANKESCFGEPDVVYWHDNMCDYTIAAIENAPTIDALNVVRCKDCEYSVFFTTHYNEDGSTYRLCDCNLIPIYADGRERNPDKDFCSRGVKMNGDSKDSSLHT